MRKTKLVQETQADVTGIPYGLVARISGFHPEGPGSIPGMGEYFRIFVQDQEALN